jgi:enoyl-CoA hydratase/carnithine racemase
VSEFISVSTDPDGVATVRLDRGPVNALNPQMWDEIALAAAEITQDRAVKAVVVWGGPKVFAAGADIKAMRTSSYQDMAATGGRIQAAFAAMAAIPHVVIAAINGYALGGGCELALTADFRFAASNAQLGQPEILLGLIPGAGGTQRLTRLVGVQKAKEMVYGGRFYDANECLAMGLVDRVLEPGEVYDAAIAQARAYAKGPFALRFAKQAITQGSELPLAAALELESHLFASSFATEDARTGMDSFVEHGPGKADFKQN